MAALAIIQAMIWIGKCLFFMEIRHMVRLFEF